MWSLFIDTRHNRHWTCPPLTTGQEDLSSSLCSHYLSSCFVFLHPFPDMHGDFLPVSGCRLAELKKALSICHMKMEKREKKGLVETESMEREQRGSHWSVLLTRLFLSCCIVWQQRNHTRQGEGRAETTQRLLFLGSNRDEWQNKKGHRSLDYRYKILQLYWPTRHSIQTLFPAS